MDVDLELDRDRIHDFLRSKLEEITSANTFLEQSLSCRVNLYSSLQQKVANDFSSDKVHVDHVARRLFNKKYVLVIGLRNESDSRLENINVILDWNSSSPLDYKFYLTSKDFTCTDHLDYLARLIVVSEVPLFIDQLDCTITGSISFQQGANRIILKLPSAIRLTPEDVVDNSIVVQAERMIDGCIDDFLACLFAGEKHEFVMVIPANWSPIVNTLFESNCSLTRVKLRTRKVFFVAHEVCLSLDGALLEVEADEMEQAAVSVNVYCRDQEVLVALLHHIHRNVKNVMVIPKSLYRPGMSGRDVKELIKDSLLDELDRLEAVSEEDLIKFRSDMVDLEQRTDVLVARINENVD